MVGSRLPKMPVYFLLLTELENIMKENLTTPEEHEEMKAFFSRLGYDTSSFPWTKVVDGQIYRIYKNLYRDKSGDFSGYIHERPVTAVFATVDEFLALRNYQRRDEDDFGKVRLPNCS